MKDLIEPIFCFPLMTQNASYVIFFKKYVIVRKGFETQICLNSREDCRCFNRAFFQSVSTVGSVFFCQKGDFYQIKVLGREMFCQKKNCFLPTGFQVLFNI